MEKWLPSLILFAGGIFSILGGVFNWDFFFNNRKAAIWIKLFKRNGARIFYIIIGVFIIILGIMVKIT